MGVTTMAIDIAVHRVKSIQKEIQQWDAFSLTRIDVIFTDSEGNESEITFKLFHDAKEIRIKELPVRRMIDR